MKQKNDHRSDRKIKQDVCDILAQTPYADCSEIKVSVKDGVVTLSGSADENTVKKSASEALHYVVGVNEVKNELSVQKKPHKKMTRERQQRLH